MKSFIFPIFSNLFVRCTALMCCLVLCSAVLAEEKTPPAPTPVVHRVTGIFSPDRQDDLREAMKKLPLITLVSIDYPNGQATFIYEPSKALPGYPKGKEIEGMNGALGNVSNGTFGVTPLVTTPREKLTTLDIPVIGLDCKACSWVAYQAVYKIEGVDVATVNFKEGRVTVRFDPEKTNRTALEEALKKRGVTLPEPPKPADPKPAK